ncbi:MAG: tRNA (adenosine(37)-N6)-dimethylallyltransferase MiaA [Arcobacteraceae bacterium]
MYKELAIIAPTASGKTALSIQLAHKLDAVILSLDSLAVYKKIDIASAKPTVAERDGIVHFGIDCVYPDEVFDVIEFFDEYEKAKDYAIQNGKNLIIVGGTGFYLKALIDGLSATPKISDETKQIVKKEMNNLTSLYEKLYLLDHSYMQKIASTDRYRIEKAAQIYFETEELPSECFFKNKAVGKVENLPIYEIQTDPEILRQRIQLRTNLMIENGLIDEVIALEKEYTRAPNCMNSIGISEVFDYLDSKITKKELEELISRHTAQLAKRQRTFNKSQFDNVQKVPLEMMEELILSQH